MKTPLKYLDTNTKGRDFVVGDIHGSLSVLKNLLAGIQFNKEVDRLISVGDMIDRGPQSLEVLALLYEPWFYAVLGNHEWMMLKAFSPSVQTFMWWNNGGDWGYELWNDWNHRDDKNRIPNDKSVELFGLIEMVKELPYVITVKNKSGKKFHILHAELPGGTGTVVDDDLMEDEVRLHRLATIKRGDGDAVLWSRAIFDSLYEANLQQKDKLVRTIAYNNRKMVFNDNLSHIISGHTIVQKPVTVVGQTCIDTGAFDSYWKVLQPYQGGRVAPVEWARLTCVELDSWKFYSATNTIFEEVEPVVITRDEINAAIP